MKLFLSYCEAVEVFDNTNILKELDCFPALFEH